MASSVTARSGTSNRSRSAALERFQVLALDVGAFREGRGMGESDSPTSTATRWFCSSNPTCSIR